MGDDTLSPALLDRVRQRFVEVNGDHAMTGDDDAYAREHFVPIDSDEVLHLVLGRHLPLPSYVLSDGTPMVPRDHARLAELAGGVDRLPAWFAAFWEGGPADDAAHAWEAYLDGQHFGLREVTPGNIRHQAARIAEASDAVERLRRDPHDPIGRGMIGEAVEGVLGVPGLDELLLPMTGYDRLRLGGPTVRETWVDAPRREFLTPVPPALPIRTERLVLRRFAPGDEVHLAEGWGSPEWTALLLSMPMNPAEVAAHVRRRSEPGSPLFLGLAVEHDGVVVGDTILILGGTGVSQAEIGWTVQPSHLGRGYATEAARAMLEVAFEHYGVRRVVANLDARNARSAALCERLGMRREVHRLGDFWSKGEWTDSYEYALLADEWRGSPGR